MPQHRRHNLGRRIIKAAGVALLLGGAGYSASPLFSGGGAGYSAGPLFSGGGAGYSAGPLFSGGLPLGLGAHNWPVPQEMLLPPPSYLLPPPPKSSEADTRFALPRRLLPIRRRARRRARHSPPLHDAEAVPLPDSEVHVLSDESAPDPEAVLLPNSEVHVLSPAADAEAVQLPDSEVLVLSDVPAADPANLMCAFQGGASSPARALGRLPGPGRHAYLCLMPEPALTIQPLKAPLLLPSSTATAAAAVPVADFPARVLLNWSDRLVFDSAVLHGGDVLVFAKGVIRHQVANQADLQCVYRDRAGAVVASFPAIASAQQVARCSPPPMHLSSGSTELRVTLAITGEEPVPSLATYRPQQSGILVTPRRNMLCACTMVRNISKFVREWVLYHAALGVDQFFLYDNGSEDNLADQVAQLRSAGIDVSTVAWPWIKTQEAGLSHCAAAHQTSCQWMAFIDVDEFIFSPRWKSLEKPSKSMLQAILSVDPWIGQIYVPCYDFGPSGQTAHPQGGVCQGYTCRLKDMQRHKSVVRLDAVGQSLQNSVHHFTLKSAFNVTWTKLARVNHYKYQAWTEFKVKFKRRVSAYVADWADPVDLQSKDRAPGLGVDAIEPPGWAEKFCQVKDTVMQELSAKWFGIGFARQASTTDFKSEGPHGTRTGDIAPSPSVP